MLAYIDICPPANSEGLFDIDDDSWGIAKRYTQHDDLEGVQFREQMVERKEEMAIVVRELADIAYDEFGEVLNGESGEEATPALTVSEDWATEAAHRSLDEF